MLTTRPKKIGADTSQISIFVLLDISYPFELGVPHLPPNSHHQYCFPFSRYWKGVPNFWELKFDEHLQFEFHDINL